jgi:hypothetical protein
MMTDLVTAQHRAGGLAILALALLASCGPRAAPSVHGPAITHRKGVAEAAPIAADRVAAGQTIYVPAYSSIYISDRAEMFDLAVTLGIRNTDRAHPIVVTAVGFYDQDGQLVRDFVKTPLRLAPLAAAGFFVEESNRSGGVLASFLVEWVAEQPVTTPVVEAVMAGVASSRGLSFICPGRVLAERTRPGPG